VNKNEIIERIEALDAQFKLGGSERVHELEIILRGLDAPAQLAEAEDTIEELNNQLAAAEVKVQSKGGTVKVGEVEKGSVFMTIPKARFTDSDGVKHLITPQVLQGNEKLLAEVLAVSPSFLIIK
jgi:uncharacterized coiled-coil protein SlyX